MSLMQLSLFESPPALPAGFVYRPDLISPEEENELIGHIAGLEFREFEFHGYFGKRRTVSFGLHYDFNQHSVQPATELPGFLLPLRERAAGFAGLAAAALEHALVIEYMPGAGIGWHRDRPIFGDVIGISFAAPCRFRLRYRTETGWQRAALILAPRSAYLLRGPARSEWQHSIPPGERLRYSVTFRSLAARGPAARGAATPTTVMIAASATKPASA
jgi:alkylated DNA repair dioxygenase AlkB